jgi:mannosyltransferase OCH1-like enzyme
MTRSSSPERQTYLEFRTNKVNPKETKEAVIYEYQSPNERTFKVSWEESRIPKIIHQIWLGPKKAPEKHMDTWKKKHENEGFQYILWNEEEMIKRKFESKLGDKIKDIREYCGMADILRLEILYEYGGIYISTLILIALNQLLIL